MPETTRPQNIPEALKALTQDLESGRPWGLIAGGEPALALRDDPPARAMLLGEVKALESISENEGDIGLGPLIKARHLREAPDLAALLPGLAASLDASPAPSLGEGALRSDPGDPLRQYLIDHGAEWTLIGPQGMRSVPADTLPEALEPDELPLRLSIPRK